MENMEKMEELDTAWIFDEDSQYKQEICKLESISCYFVYIGSDKTICKVIKETEVLSSFHESVGILNSRILYLIQTKRYLETGQRYKLDKLVKYVISNQISSFSNLELIDFGHFLKEVNFLDNIIIEPSPSMFHSLASIYFFFREDSTIIKPVRSILKPTTVGKLLTKKVRILEEIHHHTLDKNLDKKTKKVRD